ncbi:MAG: SRPBCC family protein [Myxococcota bacterium]
MAETQTQSHSVTVDVPLRTAYDQWTQLEEFPVIMPIVEQVVQQDDDTVLFRLNLLGRRIEYQARIVEQVPDDRIAWRSVTGKDIGGIVRFRALNEEQTQIMLDLRYERDGFLEIVGDELGLVSERVRAALQSFKEFVESRGHATGAWRGTIHHGQVETVEGAPLRPSTAERVRRDPLHEQHSEF